ncbi:MAG: hypothetical protein IPM13_19595 [Phycisphaerales bacterium]|nr:hypothetical protein [Phycisphaerales bacterium]
MAARAGSRVYVMGAPDAGKTALLVHVADDCLGQGLAVGLLAVDEEPSDILQRLLQRRGWSRSECELRDPGEIDRMTEQVGDLRLRLYGSDWTIDAAADDLGEYARADGLRAMFGIDSVQTARCDAEDTRVSRYDVVTARVHAIRAAADRHRLLVVATSEMSRGAYRGGVDKRDGVSDLAAGKESGAIEYSARVLLALRRVPGQDDLVELRLPKNKHGPRTRDDGQGIVLRLDRRSQTLSEATDYTVPTAAGREQAQTALAEARTLRDAAAVAVGLARSPAVTLRALRAIVRAAVGGGMGHLRCDAAMARLGPAVTRLPGGPHGAINHYLDGGAVRPGTLGLSVPATATEPPAVRSLDRAEAAAAGTDPAEPEEVL